MSQAWKVGWSTEEENIPPGQRKIPTVKMANPVVNADEFFKVNYGKVSSRMHKVYTGDAVLVLSKGNKIEVHDETTDELLTVGFLEASDVAKFRLGNEHIDVNNRMIRLDCPISQQEYRQIRTGKAASNPLTSETVESSAQPVSTPTPPQRSRFQGKAFICPFKKDSDEPSPQQPSTSRSSLATRIYPPSTHIQTPMKDIPPSPFPMGRPLSQPVGPSVNNKPPLVMPKPPEWHSEGKKEIRDVVVDAFLANHLRDHQRDGVTFLYESVMGFKKTESEQMIYGAILADEMGLGKTLQTIAVIWTLTKQNPYSGTVPVIRRTLIVCPASLIKNWKQEFDKWLKSFRLPVWTADGNSANQVVSNFINYSSAGVLIVSYERAAGSEKLLNCINIDLLVCDEAHVMKNEDAKKSYSLRGLQVNRRIFLTGTPLQNNMKEFYTICNLVNPAVFENRQQFVEEFEKPIFEGQQPEADQIEKDYCDRQIKELWKITKLFILRRTADINLKYLPTKTEYVVFCKPSEFQLKLLLAVSHSRQVASILADSHNKSSALGCIGYMRMIGNHPYIFLESANRSKKETTVRTTVKTTASDDEDENSNDSFASDSQLLLRDELVELFEPGYRIRIEESGKMTVLADLLTAIKANCPSEKVVIVSYFTKTLNLIGKVCQLLGFAILRLDGQTEATKRITVVAQFNDSRSRQNILLLSSKAGGTGLNLIGANRLVLFEPDWNPANDDQSLARIWRDGQKREVHIYRLLTTGSIDEKIYQRQIMKKKVCGVALGNQSNHQNNRDLDQPTEESFGFSGGNIPKFTIDELRDIFTVHPETSSRTHDLLDCTKCLENDDGEPVGKKAKKGGVQMAELRDVEHKKPPLNTWEGSCLEKSGETGSCTMAFRNVIVYQGGSKSE